MCIIWREQINQHKGHTGPPGRPRPIIPNHRNGPAENPRWMDIIGGNGIQTDTGGWGPSTEESLLCLYEFV